MACFSLAIGTATKNRDGKIIEAFFPTPLLNPESTLVSALADLVDYQNGNQVFEITSEQSTAIAAAFNAGGEQASALFVTQAVDSTKPVVLVVLAEDQAPSSVAEGFLKLQLISHRLVQPHGVVLDGIFGYYTILLGPTKDQLIYLN